MLLRAAGWSLLGLALLAPVAAARDGFVPEVKGAALQVHAASGGLSESLDGLRSTGRGPVWVGWTAPMVAGGHQMCCTLEPYRRATVHGSGLLDLDRTVARSGECRLEDESHWVLNLDDQEARDEGQFVVLVRLESGEVDRVRTSSPRCTLKTGGLDFHWLTGVVAQESVRTLAGLARESVDEERVADPALVAVALHRHAAADEALESIATGRYPASLRKEAVFWLGMARGAFGSQVLRRMAADERDEEVRREVPFGLAESREEEALDILIRMARQDHSSEVRKEALFWMAQKAGERVAGVLTEAIENDPETRVKKAAVFALADLPDQEGVPLLIDLVRTNKNPVIRREAMFWLGESEDPRALAFIEEILTG
jgi:hypothetical protein